MRYQWAEAEHGTRMAVTAPLSPLKGGPESKEMGYEKQEEIRRPSRIKELLGRLVCWR